MNDLATSQLICAETVPPRKSRKRGIIPRKSRKRGIIPHPGPNDSVYFMYSAGRMKIGYSSDILARLNNLQNMAGARVDLIAIMPGTKEMERVLHNTFKKDRAHGEWFHVSDDMRAFLRCYDEEGDPVIAGVTGTSTERLAFAERLYAEGRR